MTSVTSTWTPRASHNVALTIEDPTTKGKGYLLKKITAAQILREINFSESKTSIAGDFMVNEIE